MIFGMTTFTFVHVVISLVGIATGIVVAAGLVTNQRYDGWTAAFLITTIATSVTGFLLPATQFLPSHLFGIISLVVLALAVVAKYQRGLAGSWRWIYITTAMLALYLNVFVLVVQTFLKVPAVKALAPTQSEPPFLIAQCVVLGLFVFLGARALGKFRPIPGLSAAATHA